MTGNFISSLNAKSKPVASDKKSTRLDKKSGDGDFKKTIDASLKEHRIKKEKKEVKNDFSEASKLGISVDFVEKDKVELADPLLESDDCFEEAVLIDDFISTKGVHELKMEEDIYLLTDLDELDQTEELSFNGLDALVEDGNLSKEVISEKDWKLDLISSQENKLDLDIRDNPIELSKSELNLDQVDPIEKLDEMSFYQELNSSEREFYNFRSFQEIEALKDSDMLEELELDFMEKTLKSDSLEEMDMEEEIFSLDFDGNRVNMNPSVIAPGEDSFVEETLTNFISSEVIEENMDRVGNSLIKLLETSKLGETSSMKVKLYPKELGNVDLLLTMNESRLELKILVDNQNIKDMFNENVKKLNENLAKQNINLQEFSVDINQGSDFSQGRPRPENYQSFGKKIKARGDLREEFSYIKEKTSLNIDDGSISILA